MFGLRCQHQGCRQRSLTGFWCQACIEQEWPYAPLGDGQHWIVWKGVSSVPGDPRLFTGALQCPYRLGQVITPRANSNWLLSPLGAIKEGYGTHILAAIVRTAQCHLRADLVLDCTSPALPLAAFPREKLPSQNQAIEWLSDVNAHCLEIEAFECCMRTQVPASPRQIKLRQLCQRLGVNMKRKRAQLALRLENRRGALLDVMRYRLPQDLIRAERALPWTSVVRLIRTITDHLSRSEQQQWLRFYLYSGLLEPYRQRAHGVLLLQLWLLQWPKAKEALYYDPELRQLNSAWEKSQGESSSSGYARIHQALIRCITSGMESWHSWQMLFEAIDHLATPAMVGQFVSTLSERLTPADVRVLLRMFIHRSGVLRRSRTATLLYNCLLDQVREYNPQQKAEMVKVLIFECKHLIRWRFRLLVQVLLGDESMMPMRQAQRRMAEQHYIEAGPWLLSESGLLFVAAEGTVRVYDFLRTRGAIDRLMAFLLLVHSGHDLLRAFFSDSPPFRGGRGSTYALEREPPCIFRALSQRMQKSLDELIREIPARAA